MSWVETGCRTAGIGCGDCKARLSDNIEKMTVIPREKKKELLKDSAKLNSMVLEGCSRAQIEAQKNLKEIRKWMKWEF